ncbi:hypothetical protein MKW94_017539 [Papaver nudicaule]|uniref:Epidermal patterning factor-like protein n=1 Tax=Papaver nudicaule TaxID=74823 RepID=A0AA41VWI1_PAPNU|nr:hypothetical protein [Papaver nudicaule]
MNLFLLFSVIVLHFLFLPVSCFQQQQQWVNSPSQPPIQGYVMEDEKSRLGSTPPSCYNRCNNCNPCMAVQVPTPIRDRLKPGLLHRLVPSMKKNEEKKAESLYSNEATGNDQYTNYKPLGWKCRCGNHIFNP